jgi:hypothetical protein
MVHGVGNPMLKERKPFGLGKVTVHRFRVKLDLAMNL